MLPSKPLLDEARWSEIDLLCESARTFLNRGEGACLRMLLDQKSPQSFDWAALERTAERHAMMPLVANALAHADANLVPPEIREWLLERLRLNLCNNLMFLAEWRRLLHAFNTAGIPVISFKGPALTLQAYGDLALRQFSDLDLLVNCVDVFKARDVLAGEGYELRSAVADGSHAALLRSGNCELGFANSQGARIEIHWAALHRMFPFQLPVEELFNSARLEQRKGISFLSLSPEYQLLYLCAHGTKHCWSRLGWLCDVACHVQAARELDWKLCFSLADATNCDLVLKHSLLLAEQVLRLDLPASVSDYCADAKARTLAKTARAFLLRDGDSLGKVEGLRYYLAFAKGWRDSARLLFERLLVPSETEWKHLRLPRTLHCLYYVIRPARFVWEHLFKAAVQFRREG